MTVAELVATRISAAENGRTEHELMPTLANPQALLGASRRG
ncbi:hypothetical protein ACWDUL_26050 [Nocardia niigatensis]|nr:hypothetical protein [Nocardia niigatensis]